MFRGGEPNGSPKAMEDISRFVCYTLDHIGYSQDIIRLRRNYWRKYTRLFNESFGCNCITAGSKAEGITSVCESDMDCMFLPNNAICTDSVEPLLQLPGMTTFQTDRSNTVPGYTKFKMINYNKEATPFAIQESLFRENSGDVFASSTLFVSNLNRMAYSDDFLTFHDLSGPAVPVTGPLGTMFDMVIALPCINADVLHSFRTRQRQHDWPPSDIIQDESTAVCQLVPVGYKGSCDQWKEWRFCFIQTELNLTSSLNDTQIKLYIVLKMIAKNILKCVSNEISSYIMKNITYWLSERLSARIFREENLIALILLALRCLQVSVKNMCLPYYMIPGRNLLAERLEPNTRLILSDVISKLLDEGPQLLMRCEKLRDGLVVMYRSPELAVNFKNTKESFELFNYLNSLQNCENVFELEKETDMRTFLRTLLSDFNRWLLETGNTDVFAQIISLCS
ncbi:uncharacterized protein LOC123565880 [Mercenaria mercenaria]|uniref:uncharacterized protein LOC123565880 n=1 Tax=Mercenaria mercenaria TaxID=6596 RepID=UPI00234E72F2|nr:uncharacterized protein LOC123565880 [Mercenaria mercenaria]